MAKPTLVSTDYPSQVARVVRDFLMADRDADAAYDAAFAKLLAEHGDDGAGNDWLHDKVEEAGYEFLRAPWNWLESLTEYGRSPELDAFVDFLSEALERRG